MDFNLFDRSATIFTLDIHGVGVEQYPLKLKIPDQDCESHIMSPLFSPATIKTILNNAPLIIQGADKLIQLIRKKNPGPEDTDDLPVTVEGLKQGLERLERRLDENTESDIEQIKLIEELARQNKALAESMKRIYTRLSVLTLLTVIATLAGLTGVILALG